MELLMLPNSLKTDAVLLSFTILLRANGPSTDSPIGTGDPQFLGPTAPRTALSEPFPGRCSRG